ncbi:hypothetical protein [Aurantiacibacter aquimixticola]|nr:hypothetical protein [Aurantiacibacter aquimixticola]
MFEGKPIRPQGSGRDLATDSVDGELCAVDWSQLKAKLAAARDLRAEFDPSDENGMASFDPDSAQQIALQHDRDPSEGALNEGKRGINPDALADGKGPRRNNGQRADSGDWANRGNA